MEVSRSRRQRPSVTHVREGQHQIKSRRGKYDKHTYSLDGVVIAEMKNRMSDAATMMAPV